MFEVRINIPTYDNDNRPFTPVEFGVWESLLGQTFGGYSLLPGLVQGGWVDGETTYRDDLRVYVVALKSLTEGGDLKKVIDFAKLHFSQEAIYFAYLGQSEIL